MVVVTPGAYLVTFTVSGVEPNQMTLFVNGAPASGATFGSGAGTQPSSGQALLTLAAGDVITLRNHSSAAAVTLQTLAGGTQQTTNASLIVAKLGLGCSLNSEGTIARLVHGQHRDLTSSGFPNHLRSPCPPPRRTTDSRSPDDARHRAAVSRPRRGPTRPPAPGLRRRLEWLAVIEAIGDRLSPAQVARRTDWSRASRMDRRLRAGDARAANHHGTRS